MRKHEIAEKTTAAERKAYAKRLRDAANAIEEFDQAIGGDEGYTFRKPSLLTGLRRIDSYVDELRRATNLAVAGSPIPEGARKQDFPR